MSGEDLEERRAADQRMFFRERPEDLEMKPGLVVRLRCPHGVATYMVCGQCAEQARRDRQEARQVEVWERLIALLEKLEAKL